MMLLRAAFIAYQCSFANKHRECGHYNRPPYECRWTWADGREEGHAGGRGAGKCAVGPDFLLPRLLSFLHCRDDAAMSPFWDHCYNMGVLTGDSDVCGQSDGNWFRCYWFEARNDDEQEFCAPSAGGGVEDREAYDEMVASIRNGTWDADWFGSCPTADLVYTIKSACAYASAEDCAADPSCRLRPELPPEYGMCRLRDDLVWDAIFGAGSALFNATASAMAECAAAASSEEECLAAGSLLPEGGGPAPIDDSRFDPDLAFIEEVTPGSAGARVGPGRLALVLAAAVAAVAVLLGAW